MRPEQRIFILLACLLLFASCGRNRWEADTSDIQYESNLNRFDQIFFDRSIDGIDSADMKGMAMEFPQMFPLYVEGVLKMGPIHNSQTAYELNQLMSNQDIKTLFKDANVRISEPILQEQVQDLEKAMKYYKYYFPEATLPQVYTLVSLFGYNIIVDEGILGICLDLYLGSDYKFYPSTSIPKYRFKNFDAKYMASDAMKAFLISEFDAGGGQNFLEQMIFYGKIAYLQKAFMFDVEEHLLFNYDQAELEWCRENEAEVWFHFVDMELLYTTETAQIRKYLDDAPFIPGFPEGSSARVGKWIGYQIVKEYMESNPGASLNALMNQEDAKSILIKSKYKPRR